MLTIIFYILMLVVFGKILLFSISVTWGIARIIFSVVLLPLFLVLLVFNGLLAIAFPVLAVIGLVSLVKTHN